MLSSCDEQTEVPAQSTVATKKPKKKVFSVEAHLVKQYRVQFENYFNHRYESRPKVILKLKPLLLPFFSALGFHDKGPRRLDTSGDVFTVIQSFFGFMVYCKKFDGKYFSIHEQKTISALAASAFLFTLGHDETQRYLRLEKESIHVFQNDIDRIRVYAKEFYIAGMSRFDHYLNHCPIEPVDWSLLERKKRDRNRKLQKCRNVLEETCRNGEDTPTKTNEQPIVCLGSTVYA